MVCRALIKSYLAFFIVLKNPKIALVRMLQVEIFHWWIRVAPFEVRRAPSRLTRNSNALRKHCYCKAIW